jgi:mannosyl-3-phosphoglycerate phosphatase
MKYIIFTDLDGTLLREDDYSFEDALPAIREAQQRKIPIVISSSKTRAEIETYRERLGISDPFISENGGGIFIPCGYFRSMQKGDRIDGHIMIALGERYERLRSFMGVLRKEGFPVRGFGDMTLKEVVELTGLSEEEAELARMREFDEPFLYEGGSRVPESLIRRIEEEGFRCTRGRFLHLMGRSDKGKAVRILTALYRSEYDNIKTIAVGDSLNDLPMLKEVSAAFLVQRQDGTYDSDVTSYGITRIDAPGPRGWKKVVERVLKNEY